MARRISLKAHGAVTAPRLTAYGAALIALAIAMPVGAVLAVVDWLWL